MKETYGTQTPREMGKIAMKKVIDKVCAKAVQMNIAPGLESNARTAIPILHITNEISDEEKFATFLEEVKKIIHEHNKENTIQLHFNYTEADPSKGVCVQMDIYADI